MGKKLIVANWKMNFTIGDASLFIHKFADVVGDYDDVEIVLAPTMLALQSASLQAHLHHFKLAAQNFYWRDHGAYTGEVSASQLRGLVQYALVGHSERRYVFNELERDIRYKVQAAFRNQITPILCIGETSGDRAMGETGDVLHDQLMSGLTNITSEEVEKVVIAYEPVWAIGTGNNAKPADVVLAIKSIRGHIRHLFGSDAAKKVRILYGGSVTADTAGGYLAIDGCDGLLVGGASLDAHGFASIVKKAHKEKAVVKRNK